jgi:DNA-binding transcriptional ArsR family regulator
MRKARATDAAAMFAALGDATRLWLVSRLCDEGPASISRLTIGSSVTRQAITKHLHQLEAARLVRSRRHGRERLWELEQRRVESARQYLERISARWDEALERLRRMVES